MRDTLRQRIQKCLEDAPEYLSVPQIYEILRAKTENQKTSIRVMLCKGVGKEFTKHPTYQGLYKAKRSPLMLDVVMNTRLVWDPCKLKEVEEAKKEFLKYKRLGYIIQKADGTILEKFNANLSEIIVIAQKAFRHVMKILSNLGDERITWDKENGREAKEAKKRFSDLISKGYIAYSVDNNAKKKQRINEFDIDSEEILMLPPTAKG
jgi:hypothetical protein